MCSTGEAEPSFRLTTFCSTNRSARSYAGKPWQSTRVVADRAVAWGCLLDLYEYPDRKVS